MGQGVLSLFAEAAAMAAPWVGKATAAAVALLLCAAVVVPAEVMAAALASCVAFLSDAVAALVLGMSTPYHCCLQECSSCRVLRPPELPLQGTRLSFAALPP